MLSTGKNDSFDSIAWTKVLKYNGEWCISTAPFTVPGGLYLLVQVNGSRLWRLRVLAGDSKWVMPGRDSKRKPVSENAMLFSLRNMGYLGVATVHGFRSTASTILNESGRFNYDWIERQLAHVPKDQVRSAYNAVQYLEHRRGMMQWYSDLLTSKDGDLSDLLG